MLIFPPKTERAGLNLSGLCERIGHSARARAPSIVEDDRSDVRVKPTLEEIVPGQAVKDRPMNGAMPDGAS